MPLLLASISKTKKHSKNSGQTMIYQSKCLGGFRVGVLCVCACAHSKAFFLVVGLFVLSLRFCLRDL